MTFVPPLAPFVVLAFLGAIALIALALLAAVISAVARRWVLLRAALAVAVVAAVAYGATLVAFSLATREKVLLPGEEKVFCEIDCHLAYAVTAARLAPSPVPGQEPDHLVVTVRTRFDERSISSRRGDASLSPNSRIAFLVDDHGRALAPITVTGETGARAGLAPLARPLRPGESYLTELSFALPAQPQRCRLFVGSGDAETRVLIGHENSILHHKVWFALPPVAP